ncbi:MAG: site-specific integrase [Acidimicrobiales bacterium]
MAEKKLAALVTAVENGEHGEVGRGKATLGNLLDEWLAHSERMGRSRKTLYEYRRKVDKAIRPTLGAKRLDKLTAHDLDRLYANQLAGGLSPSTVLYHHRIISAALKQGRKWGWVERNVAEDATPPSARKVETNVPSPEQVRALILEAGRAGTRNAELATIVTLAALTGMRRGELCGLRWSDVDWQGAAVDVRRSNWQTPDGMVGTKGPK